MKDSHKLKMSLWEEADVLVDGIVTYLCVFLNGRQLSYISSELTKAQSCVMCISPTDLSLCGRMLDELWVFSNERNKSVAIIITTGPLERSEWKKLQIAYHEEFGRHGPFIFSFFPYLTFQCLCLVEKFKWAFMGNLSLPLAHSEQAFTNKPYLHRLLKS